MRAVQCTSFGPPDSLVVGDAPAPGVLPGHVRIDVRAAGLNYPDALMVAGQYQTKPEFPFVPGMECAGIVEAIGENVSSVAPGDRVMAMPGLGTFAEQAVAAEAGVFRIPDAMSFEEAAGFPVTYGTSLHALIDRARMQAGESLLVLGAAGGVGLSTVEIGAILGASVIAAASSDEKLDLARRFGATHGINYARESIKDRVKEITGGHGTDVVFDPVGDDPAGAGESRAAETMLDRGCLLGRVGPAESRAEPSQLRADAPVVRGGQDPSPRLGDLRPRGRGGSHEVTPVQADDGQGRDHDMMWGATS